MKAPVYLDFHSTTPIDPAVIAAMRPFVEEHYGNPTSASHALGWRTKIAVDTARQQVARFLDCAPSEIVFTSGATESNNLALQGILLPFVKTGDPVHLITSHVEHRAIAKVAQELSSWGVEVTWIAPDRWGQIHLPDVIAAIKPTTRLVSIMWANNEIGTVNDVEAIAGTCADRGVLFHTDATQSAGYIPCRLRGNRIDLLSLASHKLYGPKGVGALFVRTTDPRIRLRPLLFGGGQEQGLRSGTLHVAGIVGFGAACELLDRRRAEFIEHDRLLRDQLQNQLLNSGLFRVNGHPNERLPNNLSVTVVDGSVDLMTSAMSALAVSMGSACSSGTPEANPVLKAIGFSDKEIGGTLRLSVGRTTTPEQIDLASRTLIQAAQGARTTAID